MSKARRWKDVTAKERIEAHAWLVERIDEMRPDRRAIKAECECDLVAVLDALAYHIGYFPTERP